MKKLSLKHIHILVAINVLVGILALAWVIQVLWVEEQIFTEPPNDYLGNMNFPAVPIETSAVKAHPLFTQNRLPAPEQPGPDNPYAVKILSPPEVLGIFKSSQGELGAIMEDTQTGTRKFVRGGGEFMGWKLTAIRSKGAVLRQGEQEIDAPLLFGLRTAGNPPIPDQNLKAP